MFQEFTLIEASSPVSVFIEHRILIGKSVVFGSPCFLGDAITVGDGVIFSGEAKIGRHTVIEAGARIGKGCNIGDSSFIGRNVIINDGVTLPRRTYIGAERGIVSRSEEFTAVFSLANGKIESYFGSDRILMFDPEIGQDYETSLSFKEFLKKTKVRQRLRIKQEFLRGEFLKAVSSVISILNVIKDKKK